MADKILRICQRMVKQAFHRIIFELTRPISPSLLQNCNIHFGNSLHTNSIKTGSYSVRKEVENLQITRSLTEFAVESSRGRWRVHEETQILIKLEGGFV